MDRSAGLRPAIEATRIEAETAVGRISYYADSNPSGRALLLLHSLNAAPSAFEMKPLFDHYRGKRPVYALDWPGFGFSERGPRDYSVEMYRVALRAMLGSIEGDPPDVIALSLASEFAARTAIDHPSEMSSLSLISPTGFGLRNPPGGATSERIDRFLAIPLLGEGLFRLVTSRTSIDYFMSKNFYGRPSPEMIEYAVATAHQPGARYAPFRFLSGKLFAQNACATIYAKVTIPTLVLFDEDPNVTFEKLPAWEKASTGRRTVRIPNTRGLPHWEELARTTLALDQFWRDSKPG